MDIWKIDKLILFLIFFIPGFISLKIYDLLIAGERRDFAKSLYEVIGYTTLNFAALSWLIILIHSGNFPIQYKFWYFFFLFVILFLFPIFWPIIFIKLSSWRFFSKYVIHPCIKPWDYVFNKREKFWVIVHLKNGKMLGGIYGENSFASSYPAEEEIYLEEMWKLDKNGVFLEPLKRSKGMIILKDEILSIEFFK